MIPLTVTITRTLVPHMHKLHPLTQIPERERGARCYMQLEIRSVKSKSFFSLCLLSGKKKPRIRNRDAVINFGTNWGPLLVFQSFTLEDIFFWAREHLSSVFSKSRYALMSSSNLGLSGAKQIINVLILFPGHSWRSLSVWAFVTSERAEETYEATFYEKRGLKTPSSSSRTKVLSDFNHTSCSCDTSTHFASWERKGEKVKQTCEIGQERLLSH